MTLILEHLEKRFGPTHAVDGLTLPVARGEFVGVIGRSGR